MIDSLIDFVYHCEDDSAIVVGIDAYAEIRKNDLIMFDGIIGKAPAYFCGLRLIVDPDEEFFREQKA